ncbi:MULTISPECIES: GTP pyrophosphokinase family protein [unclassified Dermacoccus]|uniref:GTP pyrophosphokinase n=1 Tax=Dermacoccus abyssi TaxID=322596 RepID=A0ABX5ZCK5_9MICO|nr:MULTISPECIES: GTP pyrophosphokinase [unclassified Dermacoccus]KLO63957.1 GTP pyrophosphokinase [Dermacoccus sp. PE3]MBZ4498722.1 GTP pyrophosphokinase [Dermacoccus sp. Tok2021]QEH94463.1 GTP pyrophosphokinase [Dermacoccus abyssi]RYI21354.1 GTP pyrophosphokinase [Dermacoccus sp. 147Ba]
MSRKSLQRANATYASRHPRTVRRTDETVRRIRAIVDDAGINYLSVTGRAKSPASFSAKVVRRAEQLGHTDFDPLVEITDQVGVRIVTYTLSDIEPVAQLLGDHYTVLEDRDMGRETASEGRFGYASRHMLISTDPDATGYEASKCVSVQLRTVLQHAWAEFEHDARYKGEVPSEHASELDRRFTLAAGLIELADREFSVIRDTLASGVRERDFDDAGGRIDPRELASFLAGRYADSRFSRVDHYVDTADLLTELGVESIHDLRVELQGVSSERVSRAMGYSFPPGAVRRLEDDLLARFRERFVELPGNAERQDSLRGRLQRLGNLS